MRSALIIEDDPISAELMELVLARIPGLLVHSVPTAAEARAELATDRPLSLVITDVHLPGEDGLSLLEAIRAMPGRSHIPVIVVTSSDDDRVRLRAERAGADRFLRKPWSAAGLRDAVHSVLNGT